MAKRFFSFYLHFTFLVVSVIGSSNEVPAIFIFGDSLFDAGNNHFIKNCTAQADFPPYGSSFFHRPTGRFTNGRTVADFISEFIGIPLQKPYMEIMGGSPGNIPANVPANGINFASAGSGVLRATNNDSGVTPIQVQLQQFETLVRHNQIPKNLLRDSLFFLESGSNDIFNYFVPFDSPTLSPDAFVQAMLAEVVGFLDAIYRLGARRIVVFGLGPVGCVPARALLPGAPVSRCYGKMNKMVKNYNFGLDNLVKAVPGKYPDAVGVYGAVYRTVQAFRANPNGYGFGDVGSACCGYGTLGGQVQCGKEGFTVCNNPNDHLFWDFFHPSERTNKLISKAFWAGGPTRIRPINLKKLAGLRIIDAQPT